MHRMEDNVQMKEDVFRTLEDCVREAYPCEACGLLLGNGDGSPVEELRQMRNQAGEGLCSRSFLIDPFQMYRMERKLEEDGKVLLGFYHSHPDCAAVLSEADEQYMIPGLLYLICSVSAERTEEIRAYRKQSADSRTEEFRIQ